MIRIIDMSDATSEEGSFSVWDTVRNEFKYFSGECCWSNMQDFSYDCNDNEMNERVGRLVVGAFAKDCSCKK